MHTDLATAAAAPDPFAVSSRPGPPDRWLGQPLMRAMQRDFLGFMQAQQRAHGDIVFMRLYWEQACAVLSPELMRAVVVDHAHALVRQERAVQVFSEFQGRSLMTSEGPDWQRQHRLLMPVFTPRRVARHAELMAAAARQALDEAVPAHQPSALVNVDALTTRLTMAVMLRTLFSSTAVDRTAEAARASQILTHRGMRELFWPVTLPDWLPLPGKADKRWALGLLNGLIAAHIRARLSEPPGTAPKDDLLAMLLAARDDEAGAGDAGLSAAEVHDQCKLMFLAGHDTTASALQWWLWLMAQHPAAAERAHQEVQRVLAGREPSAADLPQLDWLTATLKEALRLYPPAPSLTARRTTQELQVAGWRIPRRTLVFSVPWVAHHDARWFPEPEVFRPERFTADAPPPPRGAWMPFGTGPRVCIGQHFAMLEMTLVAAMLLQRYTLHTEPGQAEPRPVLNVTLRPAQPIWLHLARR
jgi:cytochrome P450